MYLLLLVAAVFRSKTVNKLTVRKTILVKEIRTMVYCLNIYMQKKYYYFFCKITSKHIIKVVVIHRIFKTTITITAVAQEEEKTVLRTFFLCRSKITLYGSWNSYLGFSKMLVVELA